MAVKEILKVQNNNVPEMLLSKGIEVDITMPYSSEVKRVIQDLLDTIETDELKKGAAGLAAPQLGYPQRICVVRKFDEQDEYYEEEQTTNYRNYVLVNPVLVKESKEKTIEYEGCLSIPDTYGLVKRPRKIKVGAYDESGKKIQLNASGYFSRIMQHEMDHLHGILFTSKVIGKTMTEKQLDAKIEELRRA